jgi:D-alanyl-D-alanine carboxypeptidase (penicillin-binding protein 5/6)
MSTLHLLRYSFFTAVFLLIHSAQVWAAPSVLAESAILINARTGGVIFEKNADVRRAPASLTKMMTCILCLESKGLNAEFKVTQAAAATEDSYLEMKGGERLLSGELMREMMMESDNGAAVVVAQNVSGSILKFADRMNEKAKELGCKKTHFSNPHGLTAKWHYSTARDMAKIAAYCMKNPDFRNLVNHQKSVIHWHLPSNRTYKSETTNELLGKYDGANGIKTGWTNAAKGCVAASAKRGDVELIAIVMKSKNHDTRFADAKKLLDYGFSVGGKGKVPAEQPVKADTKRVPNVKKPGTSFSSTASNKPASASVTESKQVVTKQPVATQPAVVSSSMTKQSEPVSVSNHSTSTPAVSAKAPAASSTPTANNTGIRMPVVRRPGA